MSRWGSWCGKQGHAPRLPALKPHHQHAHAQAQAQAPSSSSSNEESASSSERGQIKQK